MTPSVASTEIGRFFWPSVHPVVAEEMFVAWCLLVVMMVVNMWQHRVR